MKDSTVILLALLVLFEITVVVIALLTERGAI